MAPDFWRAATAASSDSISWRARMISNGPSAEPTSRGVATETAASAVT